MSEEPRPLSGYKSKVHEQNDFDSPNAGKPLLTEFDEYTLRLTSPPKVKTFQQLKKINGVEKAINVDKAIIVFEEENTKNEVISLMRVDSLNFSEDDAFESAIIRFFRKIRHPLVEGVEPNWDDYFVVGMRFLARVVVGKDDKKVPNGKYYLDVPTCRPLGVVTKTFERVASEDVPRTIMPSKPSLEAANLANAKIIVHGCVNVSDAIKRLADAKVSQPVMTAFIDANANGELTYPI